jgi:hypothetical protein
MQEYSNLNVDSYYDPIKTVLLVKNKSKQSIDTPKIFHGKTIDNFRVWHKSIKTYF